MTRGPPGVCSLSRATHEREEPPMIRPGDRPENPATGELLVFHRAAAETGGESVLVETIVRPDGFVAAVHVHPHQTFIKGSILTATSKCCKSTRTKKARFPDLLQSPLTDSNRRPPPYHGAPKATGRNPRQRLSLVWAVLEA